MSLNIHIFLCLFILVTLSLSLSPCILHLFPFFIQYHSFFLFIYPSHLYSPSATHTVGLASTPAPYPPAPAAAPPVEHGIGRAVESPLLARLPATTALSEHLALARPLTHSVRAGAQVWQVTLSPRLLLHLISCHKERKRQEKERERQKKYARYDCLVKLLVVSVEDGKC